MRLSRPTGTCRLLAMFAVLALAAHADDALQFSEFNAISTVGAFILGLSQLLFAWNVWRCVRGGEHTERATARAWENAAGLEWQLPSPPPHHSWQTQPEIK